MRWRLSFICCKDLNALNKVQVRPTLLEKLKNGGRPVSLGFTGGKANHNQFHISCLCVRKGELLCCFVCVFAFCVPVHACLFLIACMRSKLPTPVGTKMIILALTHLSTPSSDQMCWHLIQTYNAIRKAVPHSYLLITVMWQQNNNRDVRQKADISNAPVSDMKRGLLNHLIENNNKHLAN